MQVCGTWAPWCSICADPCCQQAGLVSSSVAVAATAFSILGLVYIDCHPLGGDYVVFFCAWNLLFYYFYSLPFNGRIRGWFRWRCCRTCEDHFSIVLKCKRNLKLVLQAESSWSVLRFSFRVVSGKISSTLRNVYCIGLCYQSPECLANSNWNKPPFLSSDPWGGHIVLLPTKAPLALSDRQASLLAMRFAHLLVVGNVC